MADLGAMCVWIALALASYGAVGSVLGKLRGSPELVVSAQRASHLTVLALTVATLSLVTLFINRDFEVAYVAAHSDIAMEDHFTWVAFYAGNEGSLLYIAFVLSIMASIAIWRAPAATRETLPHTNGVLMVVLTFFLAVIGFMANPFDKLPFVPLDGEGINPLLTHFGMFFHPPALMAGLIAASIPLAFVLGSLIGGKTGDQWLDAARVWGIISWALLACGLLLGSWWAYTILGWGGYWFWDPVENAALMPWLGLTAFIHSVMVQKRRGMFRMWNIVLINVAFGLALYGMFMNRGGSVPSVHSFGASTLGWIFLLFLAVGVIVPFAIFFWRYNRLKSDRDLDSMLSREAAFLINNLLLLAIAFVTLWGTVYPLLSQLFTGEEITLARPFYDQVNGPIFLALILLMGVGPMLPWRQATWAAVRRSLLVPSIAAVGVIVVLLAVGIWKPYALVWVRPGRYGDRGHPPGLGEGHTEQPPEARGGEPCVTAFVHLIWGNRPRYGGYIVHSGRGHGCLGRCRHVLLQHTAGRGPRAGGERNAVREYQVRYLGTTEEFKGNRTEYLSRFEVYRNGEFAYIMEPGRHFYPSFNMASTRAAIHSTPVEDSVPGHQREHGRWQRRGAHSGQPPHLVDVGCRAGYGRRNAHRPLAATRQDSGQGLSAAHSRKPAAPGHRAGRCLTVSAGNDRD